MRSLTDLSEVREGEETKGGKGLECWSKANGAFPSVMGGMDGFKKLLFQILYL